MKLDLTIQEANLILASLGRMPYEHVFALVEKIRSQAISQGSESSQSSPSELSSGK